MNGKLLVDAFAPNQTVIKIGDNEVLFSYSTPVAAYVDGCWYRTDHQYSTTTSKHINQWLRRQRGSESGVAEKPPEWFDELLSFRGVTE